MYLSATVSSCVHFKSVCHHSWHARKTLTSSHTATYAFSHAVKYLVFFSCNAICSVTDRKSISSCSHSMFPLVGSLVPPMRHQQYVCRLMVTRDEASSQDSTRGLITEQLIQQLVRDAVFHPDNQMTSFTWSIFCFQGDVCGYFHFRFKTVCWSILPWDQQITLIF